MAKEKEKKQKSAPKETREPERRRRFHWKSWLTLLFLIVACLAIGVSYIPEKNIPGGMEPVYIFCLRFRNTLIARSGLDLHRYDDTVTIRAEGSPDLPVYFAPGYRISEGLCQFIGTAESTLDVCIYDLDLLPVADALIAAKKRGVSVNVVTDSDNRKLLAMDRLAKAGIRIVSDHKPTIMHHKFVIADAKRLWTGSFNFTENGQNRNDNNALILDSPEIAACYLNKFQEYMSGNFSVSAIERTEHGKAFMGKIPVETAFAPSDKVADLICRQLSYAKKSIRVMAFVLTSEKIADQLGKMAKKGVNVECILDRGQARTRYSRDQYLLGCGVRIHISPNSRGKMHHKVIVIDEETVITGSYNFSENAETGNDENIVIVKDSGLGKLFQKEFTRCLNGTKGY